jgi:hypothetical protein
MVRLRAKKVHTRSKAPNAGQFKEGHGNGGRPPGSRNRMNRMLKEGINEALCVHGDWLKENMQSKRMKALYSCGGMVAGLIYMARHEGGSFVGLLARLLPLEIAGKVEHEHTMESTQYETVEEIAEALRARGLPPPSKLIDITPTKEPADG